MLCYVIYTTFQGSCSRFSENFLSSTLTEKASRSPSISQEVKCDCADCFILYKYEKG